MTVSRAVLIAAGTPGKSIVMEGLVAAFEPMSVLLQVIIYAIERQSDMGSFLY